MGPPGGLVCDAPGVVVVVGDCAGGVVSVVDAVVVSVGGGVVSVVGGGVDSLVGGGVEGMSVTVPDPLGLADVEELSLVDDEDEELDELVEDHEVVEVVDGTVDMTLGVAPETLPGGGSCVIGWPSSAAPMNAVQMFSGTVPPVISA